MRIEKIGNATLYLGDAPEVLPTLGGVDAVVTDPPYGIGFKYCGHDDVNYAGGYGAWLWSIIAQAEMLCSPASPVFVWQAQLHFRHFTQWFPREFRVFIAAKNFVQIRKTAMQCAYDPIIVWWVNGHGKAWSARTKNRDFHVANTAAQVSRKDNLERGHPCPRPLDQVEHIIEQWCRPGSTVLDPFMGSGTTGVACARLGRSFIGIEIEPKYFDLACRRIEAEYAAGAKSRAA